MSTEVTLILDHDLNTAKIELLPRILDPRRHAGMRHILNLMAGEVRGAEPEAPWLTFVARQPSSTGPEEAWEADNVYTLQHPVGIDLRIGRHACILTFGVKWPRFVNDSAAQESVKAALDVIAPLLYSSIVIYTAGGGCPTKATDWVYDGLGSEVIRYRLRKECGSPLSTFATVRGLDPPLDVYLVIELSTKYPTDPNG